MFTGLYPRNSGVRNNQEQFADGVETLPALLSDHGYETALAGKLHFTPSAAPHGFDIKRLHDSMYTCYDVEEPWNSDYVQWLADRRFDGDVSAVIERANADERAMWEGDLHRFLLGTNWRSIEDHSNTWVTDESVDYLRSEPDDPFFLFSSYFGPHQPMLAPGKYADMYDPDEISLPPEFDVEREGKPIAAETGGAKDHPRRNGWTEDTFREVLAAYYGQITMIDDGIGRILDALEETGQANETMVIFTADHGDHNGQFQWFFKGTMYDGAARVPLVVADPTKDGPTGRVSNHVVNNLDCFATILDRAGIEPGYPTASESLGPLLTDPDAAEWVDETYVELDEQMLVREDYKLIRQDGDNNQTYELYERIGRPTDATNLWERPGYRERGRELADRLDRRIADLSSNGPT
jgi:arylsulfatase A-like enzyme